MVDKGRSEEPLIQSLGLLKDTLFEIKFVDQGDNILLVSMGRFHFKLHAKAALKLAKRFGKNVYWRHNGVRLDTEGKTTARQLWYDYEDRKGQAKERCH